MVTARILGTGSGRSKKHAEQEAARVALESLDVDDTA
jgi:ribonuclease-3